MDKRICFIVAGMDDRIHLLNKCIEAFKNSSYSDCDIYCFFQGRKWDAVVGSDIFKGVVIDEKPRGIFTPRYELMKRYGLEYDYVIVIDDDLFLKPETNYRKSIRFLESMEMAGCIAITNFAHSIKNEIRRIDYPDGYNICGGLVLPKKSVKIILDYFADKEQDYTEDMFWLLLWVKGYELYKDYRSWAVHMPNRKSQKGKFTGYTIVRMGKYVPMLSEYFYDALDTDEGDQKRFPIKVFGIKSLEHARPEAFIERLRCRKQLEENRCQED